MNRKAKALYDEPVGTNGKIRRYYYSRTKVTRMTILAWRLFKNNKRVHYFLLIYRLRVDFGLTNLEIANFTGIPPLDVRSLLVSGRKIVRFVLSKMVKEMDTAFTTERLFAEWRRKFPGMVEREHQPWYAHVSEKYKYIALGTELDLEVMRSLGIQKEVWEKEMPDEEYFRVTADDYLIPISDEDFRIRVSGDPE